MAGANDVAYTKGNISLKTPPKRGENVNLFLRPGDDVNLGVDLKSAQLQLVGSDVVATLPNGGQITFVSLGLMAFEEGAPTLRLPGGLKMDVGDVLNKVSNIAVVPKDAVLVSGNVSLQNEKQEDTQKQNEPQKTEEPKINEYNAFYAQNIPEIKPEEIAQKNHTDKYSEPFTAQSVAFQMPISVSPKKIVSDSEYKHVKPNDCTGNGNGNGDGNTYVPPGTGNVSEAAKPVFYFKGTAHQLTYKTDGTTIYGGGGSTDGYASDASSTQYQVETIDVSASTANMTIYADNSLYFDATYMSRILRFAPQMPEGFYIDNFTITGLPAGITLMDKGGNAIVGGTIAKENLVFKDALKNEIFFTDSDFLTKIKTAEFTLKYDTTTIPASFDVSITANYVLDPTYSSTTDINPNQSYTNSYTIVSKNISADTDYTYSPASGKDEGFVFATNLNATTIKDGSGNSEIYGGKGVDTVYDGGGDDTITTDAGNDIIYGGTGVNTIDGGADSDTINYKNVSAYTIATPANSYETTIQDDFSGVYVDLAGFDANSDGVNENAIAKYGSSLGYDTISNVEKVEGSDYNDWIYGNNSQNTLSGGAGADTLDGRGGNDTIYGNAGYDTLYSGSGNDTLDGGEDTDVANFQNSTAGITVRLDTATATAIGYGTDTLVSIEDITGSNFADTIVGDNSTNYLNGMGGNDIFLPGGGYDFIDGGSGTDTLTYYKPDYDGIGATNWGNIQGVTVDLNSTDFTMIKETTTARVIDLVKNVENINATEYLDRIYGGGNSETIKVYGGDDYLRPGRGVDTVYGGTGTDTIDLQQDALVAQSMQLTAAGTIQYHNGVGFVDGYNTSDGINYAYEVENVTLWTANDIFRGNDSANTISALGGNDTINGMGGNDIIYGGDGTDTIDGGDGNDTIYGDRHNDAINGGNGDDTIYGTAFYIAAEQDKDTIDGGAGVDWVDYRNISHGLTVTLNGAVAATVTFNGTASDATTYADTVVNIENVRGGSGADNITGDSGDNMLDGWSGVDTINGGAGNDTITARANAGETLNGEIGTDTVQLAQSVDFRSITLSNFETLDIQNYHSYMYFSQFDQFTKVTGSGRLYFYGTAGNDTLDFSDIDFSSFTGSIYYADGGAGTDTLKVGANDIALARSSFATFETVYSNAGGSITVNGDSSNETFYASSMDLTNMTDNDSLILNGLGGNDNARIKLSDFAKVKFDGGTGTDTAYLSDTVTAATDLTADSYENNLANIETLNTASLLSITTGSIVFSADALNAWDNSATATNLSLDVSNATQASKISVTEFTSATNTTTSTAYTSGAPLAINNNYSIDANGGGVDLTVQVV